MSKLRIPLFFITATICCVTSPGFSQPFTATPTTNTTSPAILSPDDFKNKVHSLSRQTQQNMLQQGQNAAKQQISQLRLSNPPPQPLKMPPQNSASSGPLHPTPEKETATVETTTTPEPVAPIITSTPSTDNGKSTAAPIVTSTPSSQDSAYTGFSSSPTRSNHSTSQAGTGLGIKY